MEKRFLSAAAHPVTLKRADGEPTVISGYGAVFYREGDEGTEYRLLPDVVERIMPGAFVLDDDVRSLFNHNPDIILGRQRSGTLKIMIDETGFRYEVTPPDTQLVRDQVLAPIGRGDIDGSSFMFKVIDGGQRFREVGNTLIRELTRIRVEEAGPVTFPAYTGTSTGIRDQSDADEAIREATAYRQAQQRQRDRDRVAVRMRAMRLDSVRYTANIHPDTAAVFPGIVGNP